jgi:signal peptidase I
MDQGNPSATLPPSTQPAPKAGWSKSQIGLCIGGGIIVLALILIRWFGLLHPFSIPTGAMIPAVSPGDQVMMEGFTFLARQPRHGDVVVFKSAGIAVLPQDQFWVKRVAGVPGDQVRIVDGKLFINQTPMSLSNYLGEIAYVLPPTGAPPSFTNVIVPGNCYFVLGDNATNSFDSRYWGFVPAANIVGRMSFCYWPPARVGGVK